MELREAGEARQERENNGLGKKHAPSQKRIAGLRGIPELQSLAVRLLVKAGETRGSRSVRVQSLQQGRELLGCGGGMLRAQGDVTEPEL